MIFIPIFCYYITHSISVNIGPTTCFKTFKVVYGCMYGIYIIRFCLNVLVSILVEKKNNLAALASNWLISTSSTKLCFSGRSEKQIGWPGLWLVDIFSTWHFSSEIVDWNSMKPDRKYDLNVLYQIVFFWPFGKTRWPSWPLIGRAIFDFSSENAERNSTKPYRKQDLNVLYQVCVFRYPAGV